MLFVTLGSLPNAPLKGFLPTRIPHLGISARQRVSETKPR